MKIEDCNTRTAQIANSMLQDKMEDELLLWEALDFSQTLLVHDAPKSNWEAKANRFAELEFLEEIKSAILDKDMQKLGKHFYSHIHRYLITCSLWEAEGKSDPLPVTFIGRGINCHSGIETGGFQAGSDFINIVKGVSDAIYFYLFTIKEKPSKRHGNRSWYPF